MVADVHKDQGLRQPLWIYINRIWQAGLLLPLAFIAFILLMVPFGVVFDYNLDEGFELMRAYLQNQDLLLYRDIWSDQPPLFSQLLRSWLWLLGNSIFYARLLILIFASSLLYFFNRTLAIVFDQITALVGSLLLLLTRDFLPFSVQVKVDMPALSLGMASIFCLLNGLHHKSGKIRHSSLMVSGLLLGFAIQIKLYVVLLLFVSLLYILPIFIQNYRNHESRKQILKALFYWLFSFLGCSFILTVGFYSWFGAPILDQLIGSHLQAEEHFIQLNFVRLIQQASRIDISFWLLSGAGLCVLFSSERWRIVFPILWCAVCLGIFYDHTPLWPHYYLLLAMPMAWIASALFFWVKQQLQNAKQTSLCLGVGKRQLMRLLSFLALTLMGIVLISHVLINLKVLARGQHPIQSSGNPVKEEILANVVGFSDQTHWLATDRAMFGFRANLKVPPEIAVLSRKRVLTQGFDGEDFLHIIKRYHCEQVLIGRFVDQRFDKPFLANAALSTYLQDNYVDITVEGQEPHIIHHYVLRKLKS